MVERAGHEFDGLARVLGRLAAGFGLFLGLALGCLLVTLLGGDLGLDLAARLVLDLLARRRLGLGLALTRRGRLRLDTPLLGLGSELGRFVLGLANPAPAPPCS